MIAVLRSGESEKCFEKVKKVIIDADYDIHVSKGVEKTIIGLVGDRDNREDLRDKLLTFDCVEKVILILDPYKLVGWDFKPEKTVVDLGDGVKIGGEELTVMAGPCSVESREQILETARIVKKGGANILRGGAFKPRTSPYSFQGLGEVGLKYLAEAREKTGLKIVTELMDLEHIDLIREYTDIIQIGARNMQNYPLLKAVGKQDKAVMLKRGMSATIKEWLLAAEYIMSEGNQQVILCERGIRTFGEETRNTLDLSSIPLVKQQSHLPIIVDPSHGTGRWQLVTSMARAAVAGGSDGLMVEVHPEPEKALSDGPQSLKPENFQLLMEEVAVIHQSLKGFKEREGMKKY